MATGLNFIHGKWHAWSGEGSRILLSDEDAKRLRSFDDLDECITWLYMHGEKDAARALNAHKPT